MAINAYLLVQTKMGEAWKIVEAITKLGGVKMAHAVTGVYDIVVYAELNDHEELKNLIMGIQEIEGVERTHTAVSI